MPNPTKEQIDEAVYTVDKFCDKNPDHYLTEYLAILSNAYSAAESDLTALRSLVLRMRDATLARDEYIKLLEKACGESALMSFIHGCLVPQEEVAAGELCRAKIAETDALCAEADKALEASTTSAIKES